jgi:glycosyltransferase involved in cell wall biosynthesis
MKVLLINKFLFPKGGDAISTINTGHLLRARGHDVVFWGMDHPSNPAYPHRDLFVDNVDFNAPNGMRKNISASLNVLYCLEAKRKIRRLIEREKPDLVHLNNFAHQISPSILHVFRKHGIPCVMTMRDYKLVCPAYTLLLNGRPCERCKGGRFYQCLLHKCTKNSRAKSLVNTLEMYLHHNLLRIYDLIDIYISPSRFLQAKVREMGFGKEVVHLPNFIDIQEFQPEYTFEDRTVAYCGRLSEEKGLLTLLEAEKGLNIRLRLIGDGPMRPILEAKIQADGLSNVQLLGHLSGEELRTTIKRSMAVVLPSECYENNPRSVLEAFALGKPAIGARIGGIPELVEDGETGLTFTAGDTRDLREKIDTMVSHPDHAVTMGKNARNFVEKNFNPDLHYEKLMHLYTRARTT